MGELEVEMTQIAEHGRDGVDYDFYVKPYSRLAELAPLQELTRQQ